MIPAALVDNRAGGRHRVLPNFDLAPDGKRAIALLQP
jgi:hypothetical protein